MDNKEILIATNKALTQGDNDGFLEFCTEDTDWVFVGEACKAKNRFENGCERIT